ncbi:hemicentin-1-like [Macrobrachium nipponense]|uniref:hemicentin-1-like n=1 Tax=Macrobrachium nipponense TaxID=159736 RepID=UPI0030C8B54B
MERRAQRGSGATPTMRNVTFLPSFLPSFLHPSCRYKWWRGPVLLQEDQEEGGLLEMTRVHRQEAGGYSVTAESLRGIVNASFILNVLYGPEGVMAPKRVTVDEGGSTVIACSAIGNPTPNVTWFTHNNNSSVREVLSWGVSEARLLIDFVTRADTGFYRCLATNVVGTSKPVKTAVVVTQAPEPLEEEPFRDDLPNRPWAKLGGTGRLECFVKAAPAPNFRWTINEDRVLFNSRKYFVRGPHLIDGLAEWSSVLEIRSVTDKDYTTYTCTASNYMGTLTSNHTLGPAIPPLQAYNLSVVSVMGTTAFTHLDSPSQGTTPSGYTLRYRPLHDEEYLAVVEEEMKQKPSSSRQPRMPRPEPFLLMSLDWGQPFWFLKNHIHHYLPFIRPRSATSRKYSRSSLHDTSDFFDSQGGNEDEISLDTEDEIFPRHQVLGAMAVSQIVGNGLTSQYFRLNLDAAPGSADQEEQHFVVVPESVEVNLGEDVVLRCVVRNQQGRVQWT